MHAHSDYTIEVKGTPEEKTVLADMLFEIFKDESYNKFEKDDFIDGGVLNIEDTYEVVMLEDITNMAVEMAKKASGATFTIEGVVDTSESAGEYMDFTISYANGEVEERSSDWYMYPESDLEDMTYEEYLEEYDEEYSEEDFERMQQGWFIVETMGGDTVMETVPQNKIRTIHI